MSHFTKLDKANITDAGAFEAAAKELGLKTERNAEVRDYDGKRIKADVAVRTGAGYDIALKKNGSKFDMMADWSMMLLPEDLRKKCAADKRGGAQLANRLVALTTKHTLINQYRRQGFTARVTEDAKLNLTVTLTR